jgi:hypothetical protein
MAKIASAAKNKKIHHSEISVTHPQIANPTKIGEKIECLFYKKNGLSCILKLMVLYIV